LKSYLQWKVASEPSGTVCTVFPATFSLIEESCQDQPEWMPAKTNSKNSIIIKMIKSSLNLQSDPANKFVDLRFRFGFSLTRLKFMPNFLNVVLRSFYRISRSPQRMDLHWGSFLRIFISHRIPRLRNDAGCASSRKLVRGSNSASLEDHLLPIVIYFNPFKK